MARFQYRSGKTEHRRAKQFLSVLLFLLILTAFLLSTKSLTGGDRIRQKETLDRVLARTITGCYAIEGTYPESIDYMKEAYGLTYNEDLFFVDYRVPGGNIRPTYVILEKGGGQ